MQSAEVDTLMKTYTRLKNRSFRLIEQSLKILEETLGFSKEKVNFCFFCYHHHKCIRCSLFQLEEMLLVLVSVVITVAAEVIALVPVLMLGVLLQTYTAVEIH
jgi:hypothetical protein